MYYYHARYCWLSYNPFSVCCIPVLVKLTCMYVIVCVHVCVCVTFLSVCLSVEPTRNSRVCISYSWTLLRCVVTLCFCAYVFICIYVHECTIVNISLPRTHSLSLSLSISVTHSFYTRTLILTLIHSRSCHSSTTEWVHWKEI